MDKDLILFLLEKRIEFENGNMDFIQLTYKGYYYMSEYLKSRNISFTTKQSSGINSTLYKIFITESKDSYYNKLHN